MFFRRCVTDCVPKISRKMGFRQVEQGSSLIFAKFSGAIIE